MPEIKVGIDVGGTFTDIVVIDGEGFMTQSKTLSTPLDQSKGVIAGLKKIIHDLRKTPTDIVKIVHGTTVATNTLIEHKGARAALLTTKGFRDILHIGRQTRPSLYAFHVQRPSPLIPRKYRFEVDERTFFTGEISKGVSRQEIREIQKKMEEYKIESLAICFLHSYVNKKNEEDAESILREIDPSLLISLSSKILPEYREYERFNTTVINAYVRPVMENYIQALERKVMELGVKPPLKVMQSNGGIMSAQLAYEKNVNTLLSGPAAGVLAGTYIANQTGLKDLITMDMGGTSYDVSMVRNGQPVMSTSGAIEGYPVKIPMIHIHTIGAGGGSIAWIDKGGALQVGPESAGANPGPICYDNQGEDVTITDANAVLGRIGDAIVQGEIPLNIQKARDLILEKLARPLGFSLEEICEGILAVANSKMARATRVITVERGYDPKDFTLLAGGGAGPLHAIALARELNMSKVLIPYAPGNLSALGLLVAPVKYDSVRTSMILLHQVDMKRIADLFQEMYQEIFPLVLETVSGKDENIVLETFFDLRYFGQAYEITVLFSSVSGSEAHDPQFILSQEALERVRNEFHQLHHKAYGFSKEKEELELVNLRLTCRELIEMPTIEKTSLIAKKKALPWTKKLVFVEGEYQMIDFYQRDSLEVGDMITGPAVITEAGSTTFMDSGTSGTIDEYRNILIQVNP